MAVAVVDSNILISYKNTGPQTIMTGRKRWSDRDQQGRTIAIEASSKVLGSCGYRPIRRVGSPEDGLYQILSGWCLP